MSTNYCPKTCNQLSVAVILISVGIIQLLAGIILLKSEDVSLLAGTDFVVAASNVLVGSLLGVAASVWEKKKKFASLKSTARQNVIAGLYISALTMNATAAIIMILGDGNKLLISKDNASDVSGDFVFEILAIAYVTSVCSPIVCLVIALVCLSGNRIQIYDNMKEKNSITKSESYGWVYENNHDCQSKNFGAVFQDSTVRSASVSDDNVFLEKRTGAEKLKPSKKTKARNSFTSLSEFKSPLDIWNQKRNKIMEEITSPQPIFFADDYLQFPDFRFDTCIGTIIPRIKQTSFIQTSGHGSTPTAGTANSENLGRKVAKVEKTMSNKPSTPHLEELNLKLASRRMSYPDSACFNDNIDYSEEKFNALPQTEFKDLRNSIDVPDAQTSNSDYSKLHGTLANSMEQPDTKRLNLPIHTNVFDFEATESPKLPSESFDMFDNQSSLEWFQNPRDLRRDSIDSGSSGLTAETISELKAKISRRNFDEDENHEQRQFMRSFKHDIKRKSHLSESDIEDKQSAFQKLHDQYRIFAQNSDSDNKVALAGEVVPISIRPNAIDRVNSIPLDTICAQAPSRYSVTLNNLPHQRLETNSDNSELFFSTGGSESSPTANFSPNYKEISTNKADAKSTGSIKHTERKSDFRQRMPFMGSITESPTEESGQSDHRLSNSEKPNCEFSLSPSEEDKVSDLPKNGMRLAKNSFSLKRFSTKAAPNLLNRLWSMKRCETKTDLTSLIMDSDSLVGLSDEELMDRTRRLRQLRKSVELRSKVEKHDDIVLPLSNETE